VGLCLTLAYVLIAGWYYLGSLRRESLGESLNYLTHYFALWRWQGEEMRWKIKPK